jgi:hypothetical protein
MSDTANNNCVTENDATVAQPAKSKKTKVKKARSQGSLLVDLTQGMQKWHTPDGIPFASIVNGEHREHWPIKSQAFRRWLQHAHYRQCHVAANAQSLQDALGVLEGKALFEGREYPTAVRLGEFDGAVYLDLCNADWQAVEITSTGWRITNNCPVKFRRSKAMLALPEPVASGDAGADEMRRLLGVTDEDWPLSIGWLVGAMRPSGPYPILNLYGEQGSAKTTTARKIRALVDPNSAPMRSEPKEPRDLMIAANNGWVIALDNLSHISSWMSDGLCRVSTGGGFSTRTLYENDEETIFDSQRPVILTGIEELATRGDLLDRSLIVTLPAIPEDRRRPESEIWREFDEAKPRMLGTLCDAVSTALRNLPSTKLARLPRMADFALWATAAETGVGLQPGDFINAYSSNRTAGNELALESSPIGKAAVDFVKDHSYWTGSASDLLTELEQVADDHIRRQKGWPQSSRTLSGILKRLAPNLRVVGVDVEFGSTGRGNEKRRNVTIRRVGNSCDPSVPSVPAPIKQDLFGVDGVDSGGDGADVGAQRSIIENPIKHDVGADGVDGADEIPAYSDDINAQFQQAAETDGDEW